MRPVLAVALVVLLALPRAATADPRQFTIGYIGLRDDPRHAEQRTYADLVLSPAVDPFEGARTALAEGAVLERVLGKDIALERVRADRPDEMIRAVSELAAADVQFILIDAPAEVVATVASRTESRSIALFNVSSSDDRLRGADCRSHLFHLMPSHAMLADALAQFLAARNWTRVLILRGPLAEDARKVEAFRRSADRFGLSIADTRTFAQSNDPRERDRNRIALLTEGVDHDVVFVADAEAERGRHIAYRTKLPRPVVGDTGLSAAAWHWAWERHGAPQLSQRFERLAGRRMTDPDWAAWAATSMIMKAAASAKSVQYEDILRELKHENMTFDTYKGEPANFRPWNRQLRQPILLHTADAVVGRAPVEGFLHQTRYLDTLGWDRPESRCNSPD